MLKKDRKLKGLDGMVDKGKEQKKQLRGHVLEMCKAMLSLKKTEGGKWEIVKFHEGHSHDLTAPRKRQFLKCHRRVTPIHKSLHYAFSQANVGISKLM